MGQRFRPKQFRSLAGKSLVEWAQLAFSAAGVTEEIVLVLPRDEVDKWTGAGIVVAGGPTRMDSVAAGLAVVPSEIKYVMIHDAARPFVTSSVINRVAAALEAGAEAVIPTIQLTDTIRTREGETLDRSRLLAVQTPQGFELARLRTAHARWKISAAEESAPTDDSQLIEAAGGAVTNVPGEKFNFKITTEDDWLVANALVGAGLCLPALEESDSAHRGIGVDAHRFGGPGPLRIGGVVIEHTQGLEGYSDADVVLHAISDALLGACGLGDLGEHFSENQVEKGVSSVAIISEVLGMVREAGFVPVNVDTTVIAARPRIAMYRDAIVDSVAKILGIPVEAVGVKATTTDGMGLIGAGEGIAAISTAMLVRSA